ncbi:MAG: hypothetical protein H0V68_03890, partial [Actinobacteria bacterium]|nr:hypothetical protein [Actinomycetota bacterium]
MSARVAPGSGTAGRTANVATGLPVLDHLLGLLARSGRFELALELPPGDAEAEVAEAGRAMGARIILCDPHRAVVTGPARLYGE